MYESVLPTLFLMIIGSSEELMTHTVEWDVNLHVSEQRLRYYECVCNVLFCALRSMYFLAMGCFISITYYTMLAEKIVRVVKIYVQ